jgi:hypothetical protein
MDIDNERQGESWNGGVNNGRDSTINNNKGGRQPMEYRRRGGQRGKDE